MTVPRNGAGAGREHAPVPGGESVRNTIEGPEAARAPAAAGPEANTYLGRPRWPTGVTGERPAPASEPAEMTIAEVARTLSAGRWAILTITGAALTLAGLYLLVTPPVYESSVLIQVEDRARPVTAFQDLAAMFRGATPTEGEMRILRSRTLLDAVVEELGLDFAARPRTFPVVGDALARRHTGALPAPAPLGLVRHAWGGESIRVQHLMVSDALVGESLTLTALDAERYRVATDDGTLLVEGVVGEAATGTDGVRSVALLVSDLIARPGTEFTLLKHRGNDVVERLQQALRVSEQGRHTGLLEVALSGPDPERVAAILDSVSSTYLRQSTARTSGEAAKTLEVLEGQLPVLKASLEKAERALNAFHRRNGTVNLTLEGEGMLQRMVEIDRAIAENEVQAAELTRRYTDRHPDIPVLAQRTQRLQGQREAMEVRLRALPDLEMEATRLARQMRVATELYLLVLNRTEELRIVKSGWIGNVHVLERAAIPSRPSGPKRGVVLTLGLVLGLGVAFVFVLVRDALGRGATDPEQIEAGAGLAVLATIPRSVSQRRLARRARRGTAPALATAEPADTAVEDLRGLRTSVQHALRQARNNVVGVSGLAPQAGKSFVSVNLAHLLAAAEGRVLLVDGDLRRGTLHRQFGFEEAPGLADVLSGTAELEAAVRPSGTPGLDLLPAGRVTASSAELLAGDRLQRILSELGRRYGAVIVDTPPILSVADSALVGRHAGVNLLVLRAGEHSVREISWALRQLVQGGVTVTGAVLNEVRPSLGGAARAARYRRRYAVTSR
jgi:tyrosine-protein kinase Etk/Wzc